MKWGSERENKLWQICRGLPKESLDALYDASSSADKATITRYKNYMNNPRSVRATASQDRARSMTFLLGNVITIKGNLGRARRALILEKTQEQVDSARTADNIELAQLLGTMEVQMGELLQRLSDAQKHFRKHAKRKN
jgi:hypothetical protein